MLEKQFASLLQEIGQMMPWVDDDWEDLSPNEQRAGEIVKEAMLLFAASLGKEITQEQVETLKRLRDEMWTVI